MEAGVLYRVTRPCDIKIDLQKVCCPLSVDLKI